MGLGDSQGTLNLEVPEIYKAFKDCNFVALIMLQKSHLDMGQVPANPSILAPIWCQIVILLFHLPQQFLLFLISLGFFLRAFDLFSIVIIQAFHA